MNTNTSSLNDSNRETKLELQGFMDHMNEKHTNIERDILILEMSKKLKLSEDCRFQYFIKHCEQFKTRPFLEEITHFSYQEYIERLRSIVDDLSKEECRTNEIIDMESVLGMIHTLIIDTAIVDLKKILSTAFSEYYTPAPSQEQ